VSRLLTSPFAEVRQLGEKLRTASTEPAWNVQHSAAQVLCDEIGSVDEACGDRAAEAFLRPVKTAPTLVKYAAPNDYLRQTRGELAVAATDLMAGQPIEPAPVVDLLDDAESLEVELATSLLYPNCHYSYRQLLRNVAALSAAQVSELIALGTKHRGRHDELLRSFSAGHSLRFDILMDIGGFRDMHRHRRCVQIVQDYTTAHGYEVPVEIDSAGLTLRYDAAMERARDAAAQLAAREASEAESQSQYVIPLAFRKRTLFKMDLAEAIYISELRTGVAGHFSYRNVAFLMYEAVAQRYPALAKYFRVTDVREPVDLLER
jgi:hypothetical protein